MEEENKGIESSNINNETVNIPTDNKKSSKNKLKKIAKKIYRNFEKLIKGTKDEIFNRFDDADMNNQKSFSEIKNSIERDAKKLDERIGRVSESLKTLSLYQNNGKDELKNFIEAVFSAVKALDDFIKPLGDSEKGLTPTIIEGTKIYINDVKNELNKAQKIIAERIDVSDNLSSEIKGITVNISDSVKKLETYLKDILNSQKEVSAEVIKEVKSYIESLSGFIISMQQKLERQHQEIINSETGVSAVVIKELQKYSENNKMEIIVKIDDLNKTQQVTDSKINKLLDIMQTELGQYKTALQKYKENIQTLSNELHKIQERATLLETELTEEKRKNELTEKEKILLEQEYSSLNKTYSAFEPLTAGYKDVFKLVLNCDSVKSVLGNIQNPDNTEDLLKFLLIFGSEQTFASKVYSAMREYKKQNTNPINAEEKTLIEFLNSFYREKHLLDFDVFELPEAIDGAIKFDKNKMQDMDRPSDNLMRGVEAVYVPALRRDAAVIAFKAIIKGTK